jgi:lysozyme
MPITLGNDISHYQGDINYDIFKNNSQFVIAKASEGNYYKDDKLTRNKSEARRVGLTLGYYHFARPSHGTSGQQEADYFLTTIGDFKEGEMLCLDYEDTWAGDIVAWCKAFLDRIREKVPGYNALIYLNQSHMGLNWKPVIDAGNGLWIAAYTYSPTNNTFNKGQWPFAAMQQWSNKQSVPGISSPVDGDVFFGDLTTLKKYCYKAPAPMPPADPCTAVKAELEATKLELSKTQGALTQANSEIIMLNGKIESAKSALS